MRIILVLLTMTALFAADDPWAKVQALKSGSELRIFKKGSRQPVLAVLDEANDERIVIVMKNEQSAVAKVDIDQLDARPPAKSSKKPTVTSTTKQTDPDYTPQPHNAVPVPGTSSNSSVSFGSSKGEFETVYRRR